MNKYIRLSFLLVFGFMLVLSCKPSSSDDAIIQGQVTDATTGNLINGANVVIDSPQELRKFTKTDSTGTFSLTGIDISEVTDVTITASAATYRSTTETLPLAPKDIIKNLNFKLLPVQDDSGGDDDENPGQVTGPSAGAAVLILESVQRETINIKETGGIVNSAFTFQVQDSSGRKLDLNNAVNVEFEIIAGPGGGEGIQPISAKTNAEGKVTSNLFSGNKAGVVQVQAKITRADIGLTLISRPVAITIHGGFPDLDHLSIGPNRFNYGGYDINGIENVIEVIVGDKFSNPVKPGTAVYFSSTGGIIQGSGPKHTDKDGRVSVKLISGDPRPNDLVTVDGASMNGRHGLATITAHTINENDEIIEKTTNVLFSTNSAKISATPTTFDLAPNGGASFTYTVTDLNGNPMPAGTKFVIKTGEGIEVTGSGDFTLGDYLLPGPGATEFNFSIRDIDDENDDPADLTILIEVTAPNGNTTTYDGIGGTRRKAWK
ncbi:MAG: carboxypeptidase regulatory-like domain-containing protein [Balneolaceae bacterium]